MLKKLFVAIFFFISNSLVAQTIKPLTNYSFEELLNDENANHLVLEGCISLYSASMGEGKTVIEKQKKGKAAQEIAELSSEIYSTLH